jgi:hypothetical protein
MTAVGLVACSPGLVRASVIWFDEPDLYRHGLAELNGIRVDGNHRLHTIRCEQLRCTEYPLAILRNSLTTKGGWNR